MGTHRCASMPARSSSNRIILVGGGLANGLIAYRLLQKRPEIDLIVLERGDSLGGNHTWSFHETDVEPETLDWLKPLVVQRWSGQSVAFPSIARQFTTPYCSISSERFHEVVAGALGHRLRLGVSARPATGTIVECADGELIDGAAVIDGRGAVKRRGLELGWQKFLGLEVRTVRPHGVEAPVIMDAAIEQTDGYRFVYLLPFAPDRLLIEDTHYSNTPLFDPDGYHGEVLAYARRKGWQIAEIVRSEHGALPIALGGRVDALFEENPLVARSGLAAGLFHPTTGYSLPDAARLADLIAAEPVLDAQRLSQLVRTHALKLWRRRRIYRLLNRMLFHAADPARRHHVLAHFYRLPQDLVERFYADKLTAYDKLRILTGRPPVSVTRAIRAMMNSQAPEAQVLERRI